MSTLRAAPYYLGNTVSVFARVTATNQIGNSSISSEGNGANMPIAAIEPDAPSAFFTESQSSSSITFSWNEPYNGGEAITDYEIDWNQGDTIN